MQAINVIPGIPNTKMSTIRSFAEIDPFFPERNLMIAGVTESGPGVPLGGCALILFDAGTDIGARQGLSNSDGTYNIPIPKGLSQPQSTTWYLIAYLAGSPDKAGTTVNNLVGS